MEEELNEHELEERLYAMLHHVDETQTNVGETVNNDAGITEGSQRGTVRRYWRTSAEPTPYQKVNTPKGNTSISNNKVVPKDPAVLNNKTTINSTKPKEEKSVSPTPQTPVDHSIFQSPTPQIVKKTIQIIDFEEDHPVILESSDEDEVIEIALPPKPTITIESSDDEELQVVKPNSATKTQPKASTDNKNANGDRDSASPVPSVVSSASDDFIRGDCIALNISSRSTENPSFDFSLHGSDLLCQTPSKKKKKKKSKESATSTPLTASANKQEQTVINIADECFATPKGKAKNRRQKKSHTIAQKVIQTPDIYDSDSNQSLIDTSKKNSYIVTEKSLPSADVYDSDSSQSENINANKVNQHAQSQNVDSSSQGTRQTMNDPQDDTLKTISFVDLTENYVTLDVTGITESIVMGNVSGFTESEDYGDENIPQNNVLKFCSSKIPPILNEDLDFDNLKGKEKFCKNKRYSLTTLRAEMEKFYNESWGGEEFNHREIQKNMSRDKSLWMIDAKDRMPSLSRKRINCHYCNRPGHRDDACRQKPRVCYMCGDTGHFEPRCPSKICVNCGSPNYVYSTMCRNCAGWGRVTCAECGQFGHPASHCPDTWRRYHSTIDNNSPLQKCQAQKNHRQLFCSGCARRGHLVHTCRNALPFSGLPVYSPYVCCYRPIYPPDAPSAPRLRTKSQEPPAAPKRHSKSPAPDPHPYKKRHLSLSEDRNPKSPAQDRPADRKAQDIASRPPLEKAPTFIPVPAANRDKRGQVIQDNEVSDTSDAVTAARVFAAKDVLDALHTKDGHDWLTNTSQRLRVTVDHADGSYFLDIRGKIADQETFQAELRDYVKRESLQTTKTANDGASNGYVQHADGMSLPKNKQLLSRMLRKALKSLDQDLGDPKAIYKKLNLLLKHHQKLLKQRQISPKTLSKNRTNTNQMLKRLNMLLVGQAGLAGGPAHLARLRVLDERVRACKMQVPPELRGEIAEHYQIIFTCLPRDDYSDLIKKYYNNNPHRKLLTDEAGPTPPMTNRRPIPPLMAPMPPHLAPMPSHLATMPPHLAPIPPLMAPMLPLLTPVPPLMKPAPPFMNPMKQNFLPRPAEGGQGDGGGQKSMLGKLVFYRKRLKQARATGPVLKKTREDLSRKLHSFINTMYRKDKVTSKSMKKVRKVIDQVQNFLANV